MVAEHVYTGANQISKQCEKTPIWGGRGGRRLQNTTTICGYAHTADMSQKRTFASLVETDTSSPVPDWPANHNVRLPTVAQFPPYRNILAQQTAITSPRWLHFVPGRS